jgi:predicted nucleic acid-binding Zn ribbon protein
MLSVNVEQCVNVKFFAKPGKSATKTSSLLMEVYGYKCLSCIKAFGWFQRFKDLCPGQPCTSKTDANIVKVGETVKKIIL